MDKILYIEDSESLRSSVEKGLRNEGIEVDLAIDGKQGLEMALAQNYDLIILDIMMPGLNGYQVLQELRKSNRHTCVLMLTAKSELEDRVLGLRIGADDYLSKPFDFQELLARIEALKRRRQTETSNTISYGKLSIDQLSQEVTYDRQSVELKPREYSLINYLALRNGTVITRRELAEHLYGEEAKLKSNTIDSAICILRRKLSKAGGKELIKTVPRKGYRLGDAAIAELS